MDYRRDDPRGKLGKVHRLFIRHHICDPLLLTDFNVEELGTFKNVFNEAIMSVRDYLEVDLCPNIYKDLLWRQTNP